MKHMRNLIFWIGLLAILSSFAAFTWEKEHIRQNGIKHRYYALDGQQRSTHTNAGMAAAALQAALGKR